MKEGLKKKNVFPFASSEGVTIIETLVTTAMILAILAMGLKYLGKTKWAIQASGQASLDFYAAENLVNVIVRDPILCENLNIIGTKVSRVGPGAGQPRIKIGPDTLPNTSYPNLALKVGGGSRVIYEYGNQSGQTFQIDAIRLYQTMAPVGVAPPLRVPLQLWVWYRNRTPHGGWSAQKTSVTGFMGAVDATDVLQSCYSVTSRRIMCQDLGWVFDPEASVGADCTPPPTAGP
jgi:hypothetical protein